MNTLQKTFCLLISLMVMAGLAHGQERVSGALILISTDGKVEFLDAEGKNRGENLKPGSTVSKELTIRTLPGSQAVLLLSNGTLLTLTESTRMKVATFEQEPFEAKGKNLNDLQEEPSESKISIDLDMGSLIVKTKKLDRNSVFDLNSPMGVAGIRGTEFQMALAPGQGVDLDVTESTVAFSPPGGGQAIPVSEGKGLSVSPTGAVTQRLVNPATAQRIGAANQAAIQAAGKVSMEKVSSAMNEPVENSEGTSENEEGGGDSGGEGNDADSEDQGETNSPEGDDDGQSSKSEEALENNNEVSVARKTGRADKYTKSLARLGLTQIQIERFYQLSDLAKDALILERRGLVLRLLSAPGFGLEQADAFYFYASGTRSILLGLEDVPLIALLTQKIDEDLLVESLGKLDLKDAAAARVPLQPERLDDLEERKLKLGESLMEHGNEEIMRRIYEESGEPLSEEWLEIGEVAALALQDRDFPSESTLLEIPSEQLLSNPLLDEISALYRQLEVDGLILGENRFYPARNWTLAENFESLNPYFAYGFDNLVMVASQDMKLTGNFHWEGALNTANRLALVSAGTLEVTPGTDLESLTSNLVLSSHQHLTIEQVKIEVAQELAIRSMRDLYLRDLTVGADALASIKARRDLEVNGLNFTRDVSRIVMEATTLRLSNVNFPGASSVQLNSLKGPIDGRYPNFGTAIPAANQIGRVNFLENVRSGGNLIMDRPSFDQFGQNVTIGKISRP